MGYTKTHKTKIYRINHVIDFHEEQTTVEQLMKYLEHVPKDAVLRTVWFDDDNESHINMEFTEEREDPNDEDN